MPALLDAVRHELQREQMKHRRVHATLRANVNTIVQEIDPYLLPALSDQIATGDHLTWRWGKADIQQDETLPDGLVVLVLRQPDSGGGQT